MRQTVNPGQLLKWKKTKKQLVHRQIVWVPCGHHGSVNQLNSKKIGGFIPLISQGHEERNIENRF